MVGGGNRKDDGSFVVTNSNVFAALDSLRKKKKSDKDKGSSKKKTTAEAAKESPIIWSPTPLKVKSWADVDDDDDYFATTDPPQSSWGLNLPEKKSEPVEESESEDDLLGEGDDDVEEEHDHEHEPEVLEHFEPVLSKAVVTSPAPKEAERQLSKKERRKKELAELEALLADFGVSQNEKVADEPSEEKKEGQQDGELEKKDGGVAESKSAKKKKKKDKSSKEVKESQDQQPNSLDAPLNAPEDNAETDQAEEESAVNVKEKLKRVASAKKKKSSKETDAAAKAAAMEAAARNARLAAAKKKEKSHYNQQPTR